MCLLTFMPEYVSPDMSRFEIAAKANPDGFGWAILECDRILRFRSMNFDEAAQKFEVARRVHQGPAMFHFRWATHGSEDVENCHPFLLGGDAQSVMGHNGILPVDIQKGDKRSDTRVFAENIMPAVGGISALDDDEYVERLAKWAAGSKLVFMTNNPDAQHSWYIVNEADGHWDKDMWWSNSSYRPYVERFPLAAYGYNGSSGWGGHWSSSWYDNDGDEIVMTSPRASSDESAYVDDDEWEKINELAYEQLAQIDVYTTPISDDEVLVECYSCEASVVFPADYVATHCDVCDACMFCGHHDCDCWDELNMLMDIEEHNKKVLFGAETAVGGYGQQKISYS